MKSAPVTPGRNLITFTIADSSTLRGKAVQMVITVGGIKAQDFNGAFPPSGGLSVSMERPIDTSLTVVADTLVDGAPIAAARDGTLAVTRL